MGSTHRIVSRIIATLVVAFALVLGGSPAVTHAQTSWSGYCTTVQALTPSKSASQLNTITVNYGLYARCNQNIGAVVELWRKNGSSWVKVAYFSATVGSYYNGLQRYTGPRGVYQTKVFLNVWDQRYNTSSPQVTLN